VAGQDRCGTGELELCGGAHAATELRSVARLSTEGSALSLVRTRIIVCMMAIPSSVVASEAIADSAGEGLDACNALKIGQPCA
jgi:hypothetical protein